MKPISTGNKGLQKERKTLDKTIDKRVDRATHITKNLSTQEHKVLNLLTEDFYTIKNITQRLSISRQRVHQIIKNLEQKGAITRSGKAIDKSRGCSPKFVNPPLVSDGSVVRLHGEVFWVRILGFGREYADFVGGVLLLGEVKVQCQADNLVIHSSMSHQGKTVGEATKKSGVFLWRLLAKLESDLDVVLIKPRVANVRRVKMHYAHPDDALAKEAQKKGEKIQFRTSEDGRVWLLADDSFGLKELEGVHSNTAESDMGKVVLPFMNDLRDFYQKEGFVPLASQAWRGVGETAALIDRMGKEAIIPLTEQIKLHLAVMQEIKTGISELSGAVRGMREGTLEALKGRVASLDDVLREKEVIVMLSSQDKLLFSEWLISRFGSGL